MFIVQHNAQSFVQTTDKSLMTKSRELINLIANYWPQWPGWRNMQLTTAIHFKDAVI